MGPRAGGHGEGSIRSWARAHPAAWWHVLARARSGTIWSADASETSKRLGSWALEGGGSCPSPLWDPGDICQCFQHAAPSRARRALLVTAPRVPHLQPAASVQDLGSGSWHLMAGGARTHLGRGTAPCGPIPNCPRPPGPAVLQLEPGRDAAGCAAPSPALPAPPKQPLSKGWSSKILTRAPSVYHTVNLGFQQLYDAAGRWERTKRSSSHSDTACVCQCPQRSLCARARGAARGQHPPASTPPQAPDWVITQTRTKAGRGFPDRQRGGCWC